MSASDRPYVEFWLDPITANSGSLERTAARREVRWQLTVLMDNMPLEKAVGQIAHKAVQNMEIMPDGWKRYRSDQLYLQDYQLEHARTRMEQLERNRRKRYAAIQATIDFASACERW